jgi:ribosomal protein S18 acetylase RimI-like enzyme
MHNNAEQGATCTPTCCSAGVAARSMSPLRVEPKSSTSVGFVREELLRHWHSTTIYSRGARFEADALPCLVAFDGNKLAGHLTYCVSAGEMEVITLAAVVPGSGAGSALMDQAMGVARELGCQRLFLTTTNDNLNALGFYQRRGMRIAQVLRGMMDHYRSAGEPVPLIGKNGIPIRDEIELEISLEP